MRCRSRIGCCRARGRRAGTRTRAVAAAPVAKPAAQVAAAPEPKPASPPLRTVVECAAAGPKPASAPVLAAVPTPPRSAAPARAEARSRTPVLAPVWAPPRGTGTEPRRQGRALSGTAVHRDARRREGARLRRFQPRTQDGDAADGPLLPPGAVPPGREPTAPSDRPNWHASTPNCSTSY
jgi:hypothetical protein